MPLAYFLANVEVTDQEAWVKYRAEVPATVAQYGGQFLVRGGRWERLEGKKPMPLFVIVQFPNIQQAKAWFNSKEYRSLSRLRQTASKGDLVLIEGIE